MISPLEVRQEIHAVEVARFGLEARQRGGGGGHVQADDRMLVHLAAGDRALPIGKPRNADAAFAEHALFAVHRFVERTVPAARVAVQRRVHLVNLERRAVVAHEEEERAFLQPVLAQGLHHAAHAIIDRGDHGQGLPAAFRHRAGETCGVFRRRIQRSMRAGRRGRRRTAGRDGA